MKKLILLVLPLLFIVMGIISARAQTADDIIAKHIKAIGGAENWRKVRTVKMTGNMKVSGTEIMFILTIMQLKASRIDFTFNGATGYNIVTTTSGWSYSPFQGQTKPEALSEEDIKLHQDDFDIEGEFVDYVTKGRKIVYLGKDNVDGAGCHKLKITYPSGKEITSYIDASTFYEIKTITKTTVKGKETEKISKFSHYEKLRAGMLFPMAFETDGTLFEVKDIDINKPVDESIFAPKI